jgi:DNA end-binding protein Ku
MAPRANWKGFLRLSLVTCPIALFPATSDSEKVSFNQINRATGHRIKYQKVDAETGEEVDADDIMKGYKVDTDTYVEITKDELDNIALESTRTIEIDQFVPRSEIDDLYLVRPYFLVPDGKVGHDAYAVIRETIRSMDKVALARVVLTNREHIIALEARDKGLMGMLLRYPYEVRDAADYFDDIQDVKITKDMLDLAKHIVEQKSGSFEPEKFEDHYEAALVELINRKRSGVPIAAAKPSRTSGNVVDLMDALRQSLKGGKAAASAEKVKPKKAPKRVAGQREMLLPIAGGGPEKAAKKSRQACTRDLALAKGRVRIMTSWTPSIVPGSDQTVYLVLDDLGKLGRVWRESDIEKTDLETVIEDLLSGQYNGPVQVIAFNVSERWSQDVSEDVAREVRRRADLNFQDLPSSIEEFVAHFEGARPRQLALRLVEPTRSSRPHH